MDARAGLRVGPSQEPGPRLPFATPPLARLSDHPSRDAHLTPSSRAQGAQPSSPEQPSHGTAWRCPACCRRVHRPGSAVSLFPNSNFIP